MIKWGIIGTGNIAHKFAEDMIEVVDGEIIAVASRSQERADSFAKEFGIQNSLGTYAELAANPAVQAVYIATPHHDHYPSSLLMLRHKKAVLCEKPLAVNVEQAKEMIRVARENDVVLLDALWSVFLPGMLKVLEWIESGYLGDLKLITSEFGFSSNFNPDGRLYNPDLAGGALLDIGIYTVLLPFWIFKSKPISIKASTMMTSTGVDEQTAVSMNFPGNRLAQAISAINTPLTNVSRIYGTKGFIELPEYWKAKKIRLKTVDRDEYYEDERITSGYDFEAREVNSLITEGKKESSVVTFKKSIELMEILDEIRGQIGLRYPFE